jgi:integrase
MKLFKLTEKTVAGLACPSGKKDALVFDGELPGFGIRVTSSGSKVFLVQYMAPAGKRRVRIGPFGVLTVDQARREAKALLGDVARGIDPVVLRQAAADAERRAKAEAAFTFGHLIDTWAAARNGDRRESYLREAVLCLKRNMTLWWDRPASSITLQEAVRRLDELKQAKGAVAANRTLAYARAAYSWGCKRQTLASNPLKGIEQPGREKPRERVLTPDELGAIWRACDILSPSFAAFVRTLMLTLQRREEVGGMQWSELDDMQAPTVWTVPGVRAKNGKRHLVHLSQSVRTILRARPKIAGNVHVFASGRYGQHVSAYGTAKQVLQRELSLPDWRFHDFRRSGVTALAELGVPPHVADKLLNHVSGSIQGVAAVYQRHEFLTERRAALDAWAEIVAAAAQRRKPDRSVYQRVLYRVKGRPEMAGGGAYLAAG